MEAFIHSVASSSLYKVNENIVLLDSDNLLNKNFFKPLSAVPFVRFAHIIENLHHKTQKVSIVTSSLFSIKKMSTRSHGSNSKRTENIVTSQ